MANKKTGEAMTKRDVFVAGLAETYRRQLQVLAERLRPRIESGELAPWNGWDDRWEDVRPGEATPRDVLEELCRAELAATREAAHLVLAVSPSGAAVDAEERGASVDPRVVAGEAIAADVLELAEGAGWYTAAPDPRLLVPRTA